MPKKATTKAATKPKRTPKDNKIQQQKKLLLEALEKSLGVVTTACKSVGLDRGTFYQYYNKDEAFKAAVDDLENVALDFVESQLHKQIQKGEVSSTIFYLKTKGKSRGYIERQQTELTGRDGGPIEVATRVIFPAAVPKDEQDDSGDTDKDG